MMTENKLCNHSGQLPSMQKKNWQETSRVSDGVSFSNRKVSVGTLPSFYAVFIAISF